MRARRELLFRLVKKYGGTLSDVMEICRVARAELDLIDSAGFDIDQLRVREAELAEQLASTARQLTTLRTAVAQQIATAVDALLPQLGMDGGTFMVALLPRDEIGPCGA